MRRYGSQLSTKLPLIPIFVSCLWSVASLRHGALSRSPGTTARQCSARAGFAQLVCGCTRGLQVEQLQHLENRTQVVYSPAGEAPGGDWLALSEKPPAAIPRTFRGGGNHSHRVAIVTSVGYADKLRISIRCNLDLFDEIVIATTADDTATLQVCDTFQSRGVWCYKTNAFHRNNAAFNKGAAVREVQQKLHSAAAIRKAETEIAIIDADVCLPKTLHMPSPCPPGVLFGLRGRWIVPKFTDMMSGSPAFLEVFREPTGFFQLYNGKAPRLYPAYLPTAGGSDQLFAMSFDHQENIPSFAWMLGCPYVNWAGVKTTDWNALPLGAAPSENISAVNSCFGCEDAVHTLLD